MLFLLFWAFCVGQPICSSTLVAGVSGCVDLVPLSQFALVLAGGSRFHSLFSVEYATGQSHALVPYHAVERVIGAPNLIGCAFVSKVGSIFFVADLATVGASTSFPVVSGSEIVLADSVQFANNSAGILFLSKADRRLLVATMDAVSEPKELAGPGVSWFTIAPDDSFVLFQNSSGLFEILNQTVLSLGGVASSVVVSHDSSLIGFVRAGDLKIVNATSGVEERSVGGGVAAVGWMGDLLLYVDSSKFLWGMFGSTTRAPFKLSDRAVNTSSIAIGVSAVWCVFQDLNNGLWIANLSSTRFVGENVTQFVADDNGVSFVSSEGLLWRAPVLSDNPSQLLANNVDAVLGLDPEGGTEFLNSNMSAFLISSSSSVQQQVSESDLPVARLWIQPNGVSVAYCSGGLLRVACLVPSTVVAPYATLSVLFVPGHLFLSNMSVVMSGTQVRGTAVLGDGIAMSTLASCPNGTVFLIQANLVLGRYLLKRFVCFSEKQMLFKQFRKELTVD
jgi:hypothetical protein